MAQRAWPRPGKSSEGNGEDRGEAPALLLSLGGVWGAGRFAGREGDARESRGDPVRSVEGRGQWLRLSGAVTVADGGRDRRARTRVAPLSSLCKTRS